VKRAPLPIRSGRAGGRRADHHVPTPHFPPCDQAIADVRIALGETPGDGVVGGTKDEHRSVDRLRKCARHDELPAFMCFVQKPEVLVTERGTASDMILDDFVKQNVIDRLLLRLTHPERVRVYLTANFGQLERLLSL